LFIELEKKISRKKKERERIQSLIGVQRFGPTPFHRGLARGQSSCCYGSPGVQGPPPTHLMNLIPALAVLDSQRGMVMQQALCDLGLAFPGNGDVQRGDAAPIPVVWRCAQFEESAEWLKNISLVSLKSLYN